MPAKKTKKSTKSRSKQSKKQIKKDSKTTKKENNKKSQKKAIKNQTQKNKLNNKKLITKKEKKGIEINFMNLIQFILEFIVAAGYFFGLFGYNYDVLGYYCVLPLTFVNFIISLIENNKTVGYTATNMVMALIAFYSGVGFFAKIVGILLSIATIGMLSSKIHN